MASFLLYAMIKANGTWVSRLVDPIDFFLNILYIFPVQTLLKGNHLEFHLEVQTLRVAGQFDSSSHLAFLRHVLLHTLQLLPGDPSSQGRPEDLKRPGRWPDVFLLCHLYPFPNPIGLPGGPLWASKGPYPWGNDLHPWEPCLQPGIHFSDSCRGRIDQRAWAGTRMELSRQARG